MKKVCIITQHRVVNYGSVLQAYALQKKIMDLGCECQLIDYYPERFTPMGMLKRIKNKGELYKKHLLIRTAARIIIIPSYIKRFNMFFNFVENYLNLTERTYRNRSELEKEQFDYDVYCTGSDQVWNSGWNEGIEYPYFLSFAPDSDKKISYAASFGRACLPTEEETVTRQLLSRYNALSLRELSGVEIVKRLGIKDAVNVLDPTLLLSGEEWRNISSGKFKDEDYILVYNLNRNKKIDNYAKNLSKKTGIRVKYLSYQLHEFYRNGKMLCNPKVEDFIALIDNARYVITDSFHATAFSMNLNTDFVIVYPGKYSTRLQSILEIVGLTNRVAKDENDLGIVEKRIMFESVNNIISTKRKESLKWLAMNL